MSCRSRISLALTLPLSLRIAQSGTTPRAGYTTRKLSVLQTSLMDLVIILGALYSCNAHGNIHQFTSTLLRIELQWKSIIVTITNTESVWYTPLQQFQQTSSVIHHWQCSHLGTIKSTTSRDDNIHIEQSEYQATLPANAPFPKVSRFTSYMPSEARTI